MQADGLRLACLAATLVACVGVLVGCEGDDSTSGAVAISPTAATLAKGDSLELTVHGGTVTAWTLAHPGWGQLKAVAPNRVTYTSVYAPGGYDEIQTVRADVTISVDPAKSAIAEAYITHRGALSSPSTSTNPVSSIYSGVYVGSVTMIDTSNGVDWTSTSGVTFDINAAGSISSSSLPLNPSQTLATPLSGNVFVLSSSGSRTIRFVGSVTGGVISGRIDGSDSTGVHVYSGTFSASKQD